MNGERRDVDGASHFVAPALILAWLAALGGCSSNDTSAHAAPDGGAGNASTGSASNGGASGNHAGGNTSRGVGTGGDTGTGSGGATGGSGGSNPTDASTAAAGGANDDGKAPMPTCAHPAHVLPMNPANAQDGITIGKFYMDTDTWNAASYQVSQTMYICDSGNWYVVANMNDDAHDGAVKTYPDVHEDFNDAPQLSSFSTISTSFAHAGPHVGVYEFAYDIWLNGIASGGSTEIMIWTDNFHQVPSGSVLDTVTFDGETYDVYKSGRYIAFVAQRNVTSGTLNLLSFFNYVIGKTWIPAASTLGAVDYGVELVSTGGADATFAVTNFSLTTK